jgi:hypothetical protein
MSIVISGAKKCSKAQVAKWWEELMNMDDVKYKPKLLHWIHGQSSHDFNKLVIKSKMHDKIYVYFFWSFLCCIKMQYDFLGFERLGRMHKNIFFFFFWRKLGIFNYVKIQSI